MLQKPVFITHTLDLLAIVLFTGAFIISEQVLSGLRLLFTPAALAILLGSWSLFCVDLDHVSLG